MVEVFREVRRVLRKDGTLWLNLGDSYAGGGNGGGGSYESERHWRKGSGRADGIVDERGQRNRDGLGRVSGLKPKDLCGIPWRVAFALQADGWWLRQDIIWNKPGPMPESVTDRCCKAHEYIFLLTKSPRYFFDNEAIKQPASESYKNDGRWESGPTDENEKEGYELAGARNPKRVHSVFNGERKMTVNRRSVWTINTCAYPEAHFATFPPEIPKLCILAGTSAKGGCRWCGAPWERVVERVDSGRKQKMADGWDTGDGAHGTIHRNGREKGESGVPIMESKTLGWQPSCAHGASEGEPTVPCTVLDPFAGSGSTGQVALELGRKAVLIELNPAYVQMIRDRCNVTPGLQLA